MHPKDIEQYFKLLKKTDISELEIQEGDNRLKIVRAIGGVAPVLQTQPVPIMPTENKEKKPAAEPTVEKGFVVTSPFVGTFYRSPSPDAGSFVEVGSMVTKGQTLCIVEAMKLMNEIESDYAGRVSQIYVEDSQPIEYGDKLFLIAEV